MQYYQQQLDCMIDALLHDSYVPSAKVGDPFRRGRLNACRKALSQINLFVPAQGSFSYASSNDTFTVYTKPLNRDVIVVGCALTTVGIHVNNRIVGEFRVRLPEPLGHLSQNYIFSNQAFGPATYSIFFPSPFILKASEQMAVDFGWNAPQAEQETPTEINEIVFFCVSVKDCLSSEDLDILDNCERVIRDNPYQRRVFLNMYTPGSVALTRVSGVPFLGGVENAIIYTPDNTPGVHTTGITRTTDSPLLVIGLATSACFTRLRLMDISTGHSFTQQEFINSDSLYYPDEQIQASDTQSPYYQYFRLPVPHLLKSGGALFGEFINGITFPNGNTANDLNPRYFIWECLTP